MSDGAPFLAVARVIESATPLNELQSRGMVRLLLKQAGLKAEDVTHAQLIVVGRTLLADALKRNGVDIVQPVLAQWREACAGPNESSRSHDRLAVTNTVEAVFARMGLRR